MLHVCSLITILMNTFSNLLLHVACSEWKRDLCQNQMGRKIEIWVHVHSENVINLIDRYSCLTEQNQFFTSFSAQSLLNYGVSCSVWIRKSLIAMITELKGILKHWPLKFHRRLEVEFRFKIEQLLSVFNRLIWLENNEWPNNTKIQLKFFPSWVEVEKKTKWIWSQQCRQRDLVSINTNKKVQCKYWNPFASNKRGELVAFDDRSLLSGPLI